MTRPRNSLGWIIPKDGTASRAVYECMMSGIPPREIATMLRDHWGIRDYSMACVMIYKIKHPKKWVPAKQLELFDERTLSDLAQGTGRAGV